MDSIKISIIIPFYNVEKYIAECIRSVMSQTLQEGIECILVDDCSTDRSLQIAERLISEYNGKITFRVIKHQNNQGVSCARNTGFAAAKGKYIGFVDGDDYIEPSMYMVLQELIEDHPNVLFVSCPIYVERDGTTSLYKGYDLYQNNSMIAIDDFFHLFLMYEIDNFLWNKLFHRSFFTTLFKEHRNEEDYLFFYQNSKPLLSQNKKVALSSVPLYHHRIRVGSICNQPKTSVIPLFLDQLANHREIMTDLKSTGNYELYDCYNKQFVRFLRHNFDKVLLNKRLNEYRHEDVEKFWADINRIPFSKIPIEEYTFMIKLFFVKVVPFGRQILYIVKTLHGAYKLYIN